MPTRPRSRRTWIESVVVGAVVLLVYGALHPDPVRSLGTLYDDVVYASLGQSIADGRGYRSVHLVGAPVHEKFPPGVPLVYAAAWSASGTLRGTLAYGMAATLVTVAAATALFWRHSRAVLGNGRASSAAFVLFPMLLQSSLRYYSGAASEPWFLLCWAAALLLAARLTSEPPAGARVAVALGLALAVAALFRTQAVVLLPAVLVALAIRRVRRRTIAVVAAAAAGPLAAWQLWLAAAVRRGPRATLADQQGYLAWLPHESPGSTLAFVGRVLATNLETYAAVAPGVVGGASWKMLLPIAVVCALAVAGCVRWRRERPDLALTLGACASVVALWPFVQDRFLIALLPVLGLAAASGAEWLLRGRRRAVRMAAAAAGFLAIAVAWRGVASEIVTVARDPGARDTLVVGALFQQRSAEVVRWVAANTRPNDRVLADVGGVVYLRTGRRTATGIPEEPYTGPTVLRPVGRYLAERLLADSVDAVVVWRYKSPQLLAQVARVELACPGTLTPVPPVMPTSEPQFVRYYRVRRDDPCLRAAARAR